MTGPARHWLTSSMPKDIEARNLELLLGFVARPDRSFGLIALGLFVLGAVCFVLSEGMRVWAGRVHEANGARVSLVVAHVTGRPLPLSPFSKTMNHEILEPMRLNTLQGQGPASRPKVAVYS